MMNNRQFQVIPGGLSESKASPRTFHSAWVTNTRLMGVITLGLHWKEANGTDFYQYLYYDAEEYGFERYESLTGDSSQVREDLEMSLIGGLGGHKVSLTRKEAFFLAQRILNFNFSRGIPLPEGATGLASMFDPHILFSPEEERALFEKMSVPITSRYMLANYFLMRFYGSDLTAAQYLAHENLSVCDFISSIPGTFHRNTVTLLDDGASCHCESLVEREDHYHIIISALTFLDNKVSKYELLSDLPISDREAYLNLNHSEFVTVYQYKGDPTSFHRGTTVLTRSAMIQAEHGGRTFMLYHPNNEHVDRQIYHLYDDLHGVYHLSDTGQLLAAAPTLSAIRELELDLHSSILGELLSLQDCYEFTEPVLLPYLDSTLDDFHEFVNLIKLE